MNTKREILYLGLGFLLIAVLGFLFFGKRTHQCVFLSLPTIGSVRPDNATLSQQTSDHYSETDRMTHDSSTLEDTGTPDISQVALKKNLIDSGPAAGVRVRIPQPDEYIAKLSVKGKRTWEEFQNDYPDADPTDTETLHATIMKERGRYPVQLTAENRSIYEVWLAETESMASEMTLARGRLLGIPLEGTDAQGRSFLLTGFEAEEPVYTFTENREAAVSTAASFVRRNPAFDAEFGSNIDGTGFFVNVNDGGVLFENPEFRDDADENWRITVIRGTSSASHPTHVAGTIGARGLDNRATGMAPAVKLYSFTGLQNSDVTGYGMDWPGRPRRAITGNTSLGNTSSNLFSVYTSASRLFDQAAFDTPYYLHFYSAGNNGPGYFTVSSGSSQGKTAKNLMTVGSVNDVSRDSDGLRTGGGVVSSFSSRGPARDGRIKPDVVANGEGLYSPNSATSYGSSSGTSMASPNAAGSAILLQDYFNKLFPGHLMRASTLKTLIINSAEDLGNQGPDYTYGWGLVNVLEAGRAVKKYAQNPAGRTLLEDKLIDGQTLEIPFTYEGAGPIRISLGWTDPPGNAQTTNTVTVPALVNNLHLRLIGSDGSVYLPYVMPYVTGKAEKAPFDASLLAEPAVSGTNNTDNTKQIYIPEPPAGSYRAEITGVGDLTGGEQSFSLAVRGLIYAGLVTPPVIESHPVLGDGTDFFAFEVTGNGFLLGADLIFRRDGFEPVYAYAIEISGTRLFARVDTFTMAGGAWDVVIRNPDGQETSSTQQFFNQKDSLVAGVSVAQRPGTKLVDISYDVWSDATNILTVSLFVDGEVAASSLSGDTGAGVSIGRGKSIVWDAGEDWDGNEGPLNLTLTMNDGFSTVSVLTNINVDTRDYVLTVQSEYGNPLPGTGAHSYAWGTIVTCKVDSVVSSGSSNFICTGWSGGGSVPVSGKANSTGALFLSNLNSSVFWEWIRLQTEIEWAQIGDPGNPADTTGRGSVGYIFSIGKHEISIAQFINARKADNSISDGDENYWSGSVNSNAPAAYMTWHEAARFCNWLTSGNASNGAYQLGVSNLVTAVNRTSALDQYGTVYAMPTLNEWHKAAYWTGKDYSDYANGSDVPPFALTEANYNPLGTPWPVGSGTVEQNGTFDMMGNVWEWTETLSSSPSNRVIRGGHHSGTTNNLRKSVNFSGIPTSSSTSYGLRIAVIETPSSGTIAHNGTTINMEFVAVADAGNPADASGKGAVNYGYQIGKYEVTLAQFKVAYGADSRISNGGEDYWDKGSYSLGTNAPAVTVTWHEAAKFCNWLTSGSASNGVYQLNGDGIVTNVDRATATNFYATVYVLPTEDEWYKAAYWTGSGYSMYAHGAEFAPVAHLDSNYSPTDKPWEIASGTQEQNGTFNMMGNVAEWSESITSNQGRYLFGGGYTDNAIRFRAGSSISTTNTQMESYYYGLRVVELKRDSDEDGLPDAWEIQHFGSVDKADPNAVSSNGVDNVRAAYIAGFDPNDPHGVFGISGIRSQGIDKVLQWGAASGRIYNVYFSTNLLSGFQCLESNIPWTRGSFTNPSSVPCGYYKIDVRMGQ